MRTVEGKWDVIITRPELQGRTVRVIVLDEEAIDPWFEKLRVWLNAPRPRVNHPIDVSRDSIYPGTIDDPR